MSDEPKTEKLEFILKSKWEVEGLKTDRGVIFKTEEGWFIFPDLRREEITFEESRPLTLEDLRSLLKGTHTIEELRNLILKYKRKKELSLEEVSDQAGMCTATLGHFLNGTTKKPMPRNIAKMCSLLNIDPVNYL